MKLSLAAPKVLLSEKLFSKMQEFSVQVCSSGFQNSFAHTFHYVFVFYRRKTLHRINVNAVIVRT